MAKGKKETSGGNSLLEKLRAQRGKGLEKLKGDISKSEGGREADKRFWSLYIDQKTGHGEATIRFLPNKNISESSYVLAYRHIFQGPGGWFIENCPTNIGEDCPVCESNTLLWKEDEAAVRARNTSRRKEFYANILVIDDPQNPDNNGKVFLFKYGAQIHNMIKKATEPVLKRKQAFDPFDIFEGANLILTAAKKSDGSKWSSYEDSEWESPSEICEGNEEEIAKVLDGLYDLSEFRVTEKNVKSYEKLNEQWEKIMGETIEGDPVARKTSSKKSKSVEPESEEDDDDLDLEDDDDDLDLEDAEIEEEKSDDDDSDDDLSFDDDEINF